MNEIKYIESRAMEPGTDNARKTFDRAKLDRLKASILRYGVRRNLEVVEDPETGRWRIVSGERRWRAVEELRTESKIEPQKALLPAMILTGEDAQRTRELGLIENLQRDDLLPDEEARGYAAMQEINNPDTGKHYTVEEIAMEVSQEPGYVFRRLKLLNAPGVLLEAIHGGLPVTIGEMAGRIPEPEARERFARHVLHPGNQEVPLSYEQANELRKKDFMVPINKSCGFSTTDPDLVSLVTNEAGAPLHGGPCGACPRRSGNLSELEEEITKSASKTGKRGGTTGGLDPNVCTMPSCFRRKLDANMALVRKAAEETNQRVLAQTEAKKAFGGHQGALSHDAAYVDLGEKVTWEDLQYRGSNFKETDKWSKVLDEAEEKVPVVIAQHPVTGKVHYLAPKTEARKIAGKKYLAPSPKENPEAKKVELASTKAGNKAKKAAVLEATVELLQALSVPHTRPMKLAMIEQLMSNQTRDSREMLCRVLQPDLKAIKETSLLLNDLIDKHLTRLEQLDAFMILVRNIGYIGFQGMRYVQQEMEDYCEAVDFDAVAWHKKVQDREKEAERATKEKIKADKKPKGKSDRAGKAKGNGGMLADKGPRSISVGQLAMDLGLKDPAKITAEDFNDAWDGSAALHLVNQKRAAKRLPPLTADESREAYTAGIVRLTDPDETWGYHCDRCGVVCEVDSDEWSEVEATPAGDFHCPACHRGFADVPCYPAANQALYENALGLESVYDADKDLKDRCREHRQEHPKCNITELVNTFMIDHETAMRIFDALVDEEFDAKEAAKPKPAPEATKKPGKTKAKKSA